MRNRLILSIVIVCCCVGYAQTAKAQDIYTYSDVSYDSSTNTVTGYAQTQADYNSSIYYSYSFAGGSLKDAYGTALASGTASASANNVATLTLQASGDGSTSYEMVTGHYLYISYYVTNTWSSCYGYASGWYDYYYYQSFFSDGNPDLWGYFDFFGPGPACTYGSEDMILGETSASITNGTPDVFYDTASLMGERKPHRSVAILPRC
jgi:hypothetical protein